MKVLLLSPAPNNISPSQRFRFEHFIGENNISGIEFIQKSFFSLEMWKILHQPKNYFKKTLGILAGFLKRIITIFTLSKYDFVFIHREAAPIGPPIIEWLIAKLYKKKIIYDFDDSIWVKTASEANPMAATIKCSWKVKNICSYSSIITVGNEFLADYAKQFCEDVRIFPTLVDTENRHNRLKDHSKKPITIGWTGTFTNFHNLEIPLQAITQLQKKYSIEFLIIADKDPLLKGINYTYKKWRLDTEIEDLLNIHIGIMPLVSNEFEQGKCAFKAIQYMSLGIPAVVSPVGMNKKVVHDAIDGFLANNNWYEKLEELVLNEKLRTDIGNKARHNIEKNYSVLAYKEQFYNLFMN